MKVRENTWLILPVTYACPKIKTLLSKYRPYYGETANGLKSVMVPWVVLITWITVAISRANTCSRAPTFGTSAFIRPKSIGALLSVERGDSVYFG
ncbi:hypothetical protein JTE90_016066 [Oedothorax gibbosus]|uniref:Uncharacterized protein n=1 Tax=Oedothorax gibbosus TaxID=931172 RepID=A0AAV6TH37_9ARAC|nr:hypothetical protein JTE90_016066 [Oedothorax gibbosus]